MKKILKWISVIFAVSLCWGLMLFPCFTALADTAAGNGYVYYAQGEDGVLTAYSKAAISEDKEDVVVTPETGVSVIESKYAFRVEFKNGASGKIYVELNMDGSLEDLRVVQIDGDEIKNLDARFTNKSISFQVDQAGVYAVISVNAQIQEGFAWYHAALIVGIVASVALSVVAVIRRKK